MWLLAILASRYPSAGPPVFEDRASSPCRKDLFAFLVEKALPPVSLTKSSPKKARSLDTEGSQSRKGVPVSCPFKARERKSPKRGRRTSGMKTFMEGTFPWREVLFGVRPSREICSSHRAQVLARRSSSVFPPAPAAGMTGAGRRRMSVDLRAQTKWRAMKIQSAAEALSSRAFSTSECSSIETGLNTRKARRAKVSRG